MATKTTKKKVAPWDRPAPRGRSRTRLTASSKRKAKASAKRAGRRYPSLVDNMNAAKRQKKKQGGSAGSGRARKARKTSGARKTAK